MITSFFEKQYKRKKSVTIAATSERTRIGPTPAVDSLEDVVDREIVLEDDDAAELDKDDIELRDILEAADESNSADSVLAPDNPKSGPSSLRSPLSTSEKGVADGGQLDHDKAVVKTLQGRAIAEMAARGVNITPAQNRLAEKIFPKVRSFSELLSLSLTFCPIADVRICYQSARLWVHTTCF
jgi:hypothetical protein